MDSTAATLQPAGPVAVDPEAGARPTALLPMSHLIRISLYWLGLTTIDAAITFVVQNKVNFDKDIVADPFMVGTSTALIGIAATFIAIVVQPTVGYISDFTESRWGRRKPYIVVGSLLDVVFLMGIAYSNSIVALAAFIALLNVSTNIARGPFQGYVPDLVAEPQVGTASAMVGVMQVFGNVTGVVIATLAVQAGSLPLGFAAIAIVELVTMLSVVLRVGKGLPARPREGRSWTQIARETWATDILHEHSYVWLLVSRFLFLVAGGIMFNLAVQYMAQVHGIGEKESAGIIRNIGFLIGGAVLVTSVPAARLSDRIGRKPVIWIACGVGAASMLVIGLTPVSVIELVYVGALLYGVASGTFVAVDWALMTDIIPRASSGRYMGLSNVATGTSGLVSTAIGGVTADLINRGFGMGVGMRVSLMLAFVLYLLAAWTLREVREPRHSRSAGTGPNPESATA